MCPLSLLLEREGRGGMGLRRQTHTKESKGMEEKKGKGFFSLKGVQLVIHGKRCKGCYLSNCICTDLDGVVY